MNTNHINPDSEARRESARQTDGKFGTQEHAEATGGTATLPTNDGYPECTRGWRGSPADGTWERAWGDPDVDGIYATVDENDDGTFYWMVSDLPNAKAVECDNADTLDEAKEAADAAARRWGAKG